MEFMHFGGISAFSGYSVEGGDWSDPEPPVGMPKILKEQDGALVEIAGLLAEIIAGGGA